MIIERQRLYVSGPMARSGGWMVVKAKGAGTARRRRSKGLKRGTAKPKFGSPAWRAMYPRKKKGKGKRGSR